jgi:hypothetical protein
MCLKYHIIKARTLDELAAEVNLKLKEEWLLSGGLIATHQKDFPFAQAMTASDYRPMPELSPPPGPTRHEPDEPHIIGNSWWKNPKN